MEKLVFIIFIIFTCTNTVFGQNFNYNRIDGIRKNAPELASKGEYNIGVRSVLFYNKNQIDVLNIKSGLPIPRYDRPLPVEIWYPAEKNQEQGVQYKNVYMFGGDTKVTLNGSAVRDAPPLKKAEKYPLIIISHGYPGNRYLMSHFGENLASKGYVVVSIDHTDSLYKDEAAVSSTLYNRPRDQKFILNKIAELIKSDNHFLSDITDVDKAGLIGHSMGGYGAVINAGGGISPELTLEYEYSPENILNANMLNSPEFLSLTSGLHFKAIIAIAPWGAEFDVWNIESGSNLKVPLFLMVGSNDEVVGYQEGVKLIYDYAKKIDKYLLTFIGGDHSIAALMPEPTKSVRSIFADTGRLISEIKNSQEWDRLLSNNIAQHYATAFFAKYLKGQDKHSENLKLYPGAERLLFYSEKKENNQ